MIERHLVRYFLAVVDQGNFSRAATHCRIAQPTLSVAIAKLEDIVGCPLFLRTSRRVELTQAGVRFAQHARRIEAEFALAEQSARGTSIATTIRLGFLATLPNRWLGQLAAAFARALDGERVELVEGSQKSLVAMLDRGRVDAFLGILPADRESDGELLFSEGYSLALPTEHRLGARDVIEAEEVADSPMIVRRQCEVLNQTSRYFTSRGVRPFMSARTTSDEQALELVRGGHGLTVVPNCYRAHGVALAKLAGFDEARRIGIACSRSKSRPAEAQTIFEIVSREVHCAQAQ